MNGLRVAVAMVGVLGVCASAAGTAWRLTKGNPAHPYPLANAALVSTTWSPGAGLPAPRVTLAATNAEITFALATDEVLLGSGNFSVRGTRRAAWCDDTYGRHDPAYFAVPFLISSRGYGLFINCSGKVVMDCGAGDPRTVRITVPEPGVDVFLFRGTPREITTAYTALVGRPRPVPAWTFQPWFSRNSYETAREVDDILATGRARGFRPGAVVLEYWAEALQNFKFATERYPDPAAWIAGLHTQGVHVILWETPSIWTHASSYAVAVSNDFLVRNADGSELVITWPEHARKVDFRRPAARQWWQGMHAPLVAMGVDGFKTDGGERMPDPFFHNLQPYYYQRAVLDAFAHAGREGITFARAASPPCAGLATFWAGDQPAEWPYLATLVRLGLDAALSGYAFWGHDIGGYAGTPSQELYLRWLQFGAFSPIMQLHGITPREPWRFGATVERIARTFFAMRERLQPYIMTMASNVYTHGAPLLRPLAWAYPAHAAAWQVTNAYLFGDALLVAPITAPAPRAPIPPAVLHTPDGQPGLHSAYFNNMHCSGMPAVVQRAATVDFDWRANRPASVCDADHFSARWTGTLGPMPTAGVYAITVSCDDGARLWLDDALILDQWNPGTLADHTALLTVAQGQTCRLILEYFDNTGAAQCHLRWSPPGLAQARQRVWLPPGTWVDAWTGARHKGPGYVLCSSTLETMPIFIAARRYRALQHVFTALP
jgi:alpha-glucosidase (family GH31 glycosyl hydrolase)